MDELMMTEGVALWRQIAHTLQREISEGRPPAGGRLPTEAQLSARFGVNRHTVRRGLEALSQAGLVRVEQGRGSFVSEDVLDYSVGARTRFSEWIRRHNKEPTGRQLQLRLLAANEAVAEALGIRKAARVVLLERLGLADGRPVSLGLHYFPASRLRGLYAALEAAPSITEALRQIGIDDYQRRTTRVSARMPDAREADLLAMPRSRPMLVSESINIDGSGNVIEYGIACYPTPRVQIVFEPETK
jgi:GntR family phosphonate transport system transcriptional regulator